MVSFLEAEQLLKALGEETRLKIMYYLTLDSFCVCELVQLLNISQPSVSQHLKKLKQVELVTEEKRGKWMYYSLNKAHIWYPLVLHLISTLPKNKEIICKMTCD